MIKLNIIGISGSPRDGATESGVKLSLEFMESNFGAKTRFESVRGKEINFCKHCDYCLENRKGCVLDDGMGPIYEGLEWADAIIIGTPVYHGSLSAQTKAVIDRTRAMLARDSMIFASKFGVGLAVGGDRNGGQELALQTINIFFIMNLITPVSGGAFGANFGIIFWSKDGKGLGLEADKEGRGSMEKTLKRLGRLLEARAGDDS